MEVKSKARSGDGLELNFLSLGQYEAHGRHKPNLAILWFRRPRADTSRGVFRGCHARSALFSNSSLLRTQYWQFRAGQSSYTVVQPRADLPMRRQMLLYGFSSRLPFLKRTAAPQVDNSRAASELSA